tara:strand:- start:140 stop:421 length:282 start_codon:yes stop_codon:yes gene_type:complete
MDSSTGLNLVGSIVSLQDWTRWPADYGIIIRIDDYDPDLCEVLLPEHGVWTFLIEDLDIVVQPQCEQAIIGTSGNKSSWYDTIKNTIDKTELI